MMNRKIRSYYKELICFFFGFMIALMLIGFYYSNSMYELENMKSGVYVVFKKSNMSVMPSKIMIKKSRCYIPLKSSEVIENLGKYLVKLPLSKIPAKALSHVLKSKLNYLTNVSKKAQECHARHFVFYSH